VHGPSPENGTTQITVVDGQGNVVSMTTTVESGFGSFHMTRGGFLLNNQLTDFSAAPTDATGAPIANRVAAGKRPRSSMAPTLVFRQGANGERGEFRLATGSPGRRHHHPVRDQDAGGLCRLGPGCAAGHLDGGLRRGQQRDDQCRRRAPERGHQQRRVPTTRW
jgi:hypothetical protein